MNKARSIYQTYIREVSSHKLLSPEETFSIAENYWINKDNDSLKTLINCNLRLVISRVHEITNAKYANLIMDLIQEGNIGLIQGIKKYNPYKNIKLATYVQYWIDAELLAAFRNNQSIRCKAAQKAQVIRRLEKQQEKMRQKGIVDDSLSGLIDEKKSEINYNTSVTSMNKPMRDSDGEESEIGELIGSDENSPENLLLAPQMRASDLLDRFKEERLQGKYTWLTILDGRFVKGHTLEQIGKSLGCTKENVRQIEVKLKEGIRKFAFNENIDMN